MNTIQKFRAILALCDASLRLANNNEWYVSAGLEKAERGMLCGETVYHSNPMAAIEAYWELVSKWQYAHYRGEYYRWNEFMWLNVTEERKREAAVS